ncbi:MAG: imidazoleglycerol-phosphate dehydratase HisB [Balneolaceae bacterium]
MTITVEPSALATDEALRPGLIYGLERLRQMNHTLAWNDSSLPDEQRNRMISQGLESTPAIASPDLRITAEGTRLLARSDEQIVAEGENWIQLTERLLFPVRETQLERSTAETGIRLRLNLDGTGKNRIQTGLNFFDHMLEQIAKHGLMDLELTCDGDLDVDEHHTIEDVAIILGDAIYELCGKDKTGIQRYGFLLAMDEAEANVALDLSNRPWLVWNVEFNREYVGDFPLEMARHFFHTLAMQMRATLHITVTGENEHHKLEAIFKGFAKALRFSVTRTERAAGLLPSSKGVL